MRIVTESIFDGLNHIIPMADVSHIQRHWYPDDKERTRRNYRGLIVVTKHTTWDKESDFHANSIYISAGQEAESFLKCWCEYRSELESETLAYPSDDCIKEHDQVCLDSAPEIIPGTLGALNSLKIGTPASASGA